MKSENELAQDRARSVQKLRDRMARGFARDLLFFHLGHAGTDEGATELIASSYRLADAVLAERDKEKS